ncbi:MAG: TRAP transporter small permease subunit [Alphaproteobacteria bacterium]|nr:TRAP transporter small permease subunit [Alphaproteobacteria bacterium]
MPLLPPAPPAPRALAALGALLDWALVGAGLVIVALVFANVLARVFLDVDVAWTTELVEFLMVWTTFVGGAVATRRGGHMAVSEVVDGLPPRARRRAAVAINLVSAGTLLALAWSGAAIVRSSWGQEMTVLYWPVGLQYLGLPVGALAALLFVLNDALRAASGTAAGSEG